MVDQPSASGPGAETAVDSETMRHLVDAGFLAASRGLNAHALAIFEAVVEARPALSAGYVGAAYALLGARRADAALEILSKAPPGNETDLFKGIALIMAGRVDSGRKILDRIREFSDEEHLMAVAAAFLQEQG